MRKNIHYILFHLLLSLRGIIRIVCKIFIAIGIVAAIVMCTDKTSVGYILPLLVLGIISWLIMIYYDKLLFKIKPSDIDLFLS